MENPIIVPFDLNTARKIKSGEIEGSVLIGNIKIEFVYESKDCADRYNLLFVKKDESGKLESTLICQSKRRRIQI